MVPEEMTAEPAALDVATKSVPLPAWTSVPPPVMNVGIVTLSL
jgi:hypothetical protein